MHVDPHRELAELALVIVFDLGGDIRLAEAVGVIEVAYRIKIVIQQFLGVAAGAVARKNRRRHEEALAQSGRIEKLVPGDFDVHQLVARVARHAIVDHLLAVFRRALVEIDVCLEVPKRLEIFGQIALAFHQQAAVDGVLLVNGNQLAQAAS